MLRAAITINRKERKARKDTRKCRDFFVVSVFFAVHLLILIAALSRNIKKALEPLK
jgi:hypothetical protein